MRMAHRRERHGPPPSVRHDLDAFAVSRCGLTSWAVPRGASPSSIHRSSPDVAWDIRTTIGSYSSRTRPFLYRVSLAASQDKERLARQAGALDDQAQRSEAPNHAHTRYRIEAERTARAGR